MERIQQILAKKYNLAVPRYTSYPTVPYWDPQTFSLKAWKNSVKTSFEEGNEKEGISIYIHLPYCESLCTYCGCNKRITKNHAVEGGYIRAILKEWSLYRGLFSSIPVIREIHLGGGTPTFFSPEHLKELVEGILEDSEIHPLAQFSFEAHPANTTAFHLITLHDLGFTRLSLGIQDFDAKVQKRIHRKQSVEEVKEICQLAREIGYTSINFDLIYGLPAQSIEGLTSTIIQVSELKPDRIAFYSYAHVPWLQKSQRGYTEKDLPSFELKSELRDIGRFMLKNFGYEEIGMDHFALAGDELLMASEQGHLHRNFMGYTPFHTHLLIGLGVSSISDSYYGYAQNEKEVEDYLKRVEEGKFPIIKGHMLTQEDISIRKHILEILCQGKTQWNPYKEPYESLWKSLERLQVMADDRLIDLNSYGLTVNQEGRDFLRIICMAMDARLWARKTKDPLFSMNV